MKCVALSEVPSLSIYVSVIQNSSVLHSIGMHHSVSALSDSLGILSPA